MLHCSSQWYIQVHIHGCLLSASRSTYSPLIHLAPSPLPMHSSCNILILASLKSIICFYHSLVIGPGNFTLPFLIGRHMRSGHEYNDRVKLLSKLYDDEKSMTCKFASLVTATCHSVQDKVPTDIFCVPTIYSVSILSLKAYEPALRSITC